MNSTSPAMPIPEMGVLASLEPGKAPWLGSDIQNTLVPPIRYAGPRVEAHGLSIPKDDVGGDLLDLVADGRDVMAYVADVSGHGLRAGVLMGMIKTAVRYGLLLGQPLAKLLDDINRVLPAVKEPNMFATLAALRFDGSNEVEYILAGHVPLLHYRRRNGDIVRHFMSQFPLGLFAGAGYTSRRIRYQAGDVFALVTDGVVEAGQDRDADFGFERLAQILRDLPERPLSDIAATMHAEVKLHGIQQDDQTVLLVRAAAVAPNPPHEGADGSPALEARWRKLLDDLAAELARD